MVIVPEQRPHKLGDGMVAEIWREIPDTELLMMPCRCRIRRGMQSGEELLILRVEMLEILRFKHFHGVCRENCIAALHELLHSVWLEPRRLQKRPDSRLILSEQAERRA